MKENRIGDHRDTPRKAAQRRQMPEGRSAEGSSLGKFRRLFEKKRGDIPESSSDKTEQTEQTTLAERHHDWPPVTVTFFFSAHEKPKDLERLGEHMPKADIYFYEYPHREKITKNLQLVADGVSLSPQRVESVIDTLSLITRIRGTGLEPIYRALMDGKKRIVGNIDIGRDGDPVTVADFESVQQFVPVRDYEKTLQRLESVLQQDARLHTLREDVMVHRLEEELEIILDEHPELKEKPALNVLVSMGAYHTRLAEEVEAKGIHTSSVFPQENYQGRYADQAQREIVSSGAVSREVLEKAYLELLLIANVHLGMSEERMSDEEVYSYARQVLSHFSSKEIKQTHKLEMSRRFTPERMSEMLEGKGLGRLPRTNAELSQARAAFDTNDEPAEMVL